MESVNFHPEFKQEINSIDDEENSPNIIQSQSNERCFFCRGLIIPSNGEKISLQNFLKFLKVCVAVHSRKLDKLQENMSYPICNECLKHHTNFTNLYKELEFLTFRLNASIRNILGRMENGVGNCRDDNEEESETIRVMRQEMILKCEEKVRIMSQSPRVRLKRLHVEDIPCNVQESLHQRKMLRIINENTDSVAVATTDNEQELVCTYFNCRAKFRDYLTLRYHHLIYHPEHFFPNQLNSLTITYKQYQQILGDLLFQKFIGVNGAYNFCTICSKQFQSSSARFNLLHLKMHLVQAHHSALEAELEETIKSSDLYEELSSHNSTGFFCPCGVYMADDKQTRLLHKSSHCGLKLAQPRSWRNIQGKKKRLARKKRWVSVSPGAGTRPPIFKSRTLLCTFPTCRGLIAPEKGYAAMHHGHFVNHHCAEHYFPGCQLDTVTPEQFQRLVYDVLFQEFVGGEKRDMCSVCSKKFHTSHSSTRFNCIKAHLVMTHQPILKEKLMDLQKMPDLEKTLDRANTNGTFCKCGSYLPNPWKRNYHRENLCHLTSFLKRKSVNNLGNLKTLKQNLKTVEPGHGPKISPTTSMGLYPCPYCLAEENFSSKLEFHLICNHSEHFFSNVRGDYRFSKISQEQFQRTVTDLLFKDYIVIDVNGSFDIKDTCILCNDPIDATSSFMKVRYIKMHMIRNHKPEVDEKLRHLLDKPNLTEVLTKCNPKGVVCQCGVYLTNKRMKTPHLKRLCKLKPDNNRSVTIEKNNVPSFPRQVKMDSVSSCFLAEEGVEDPLKFDGLQDIEETIEVSNEMPLLINNDFKNEHHQSEDVGEMPELELEVQGSLN